SMLLISKKALIEEKLYAALKDHQEVSVVAVQMQAELEIKSLLPLGARFCACFERITEATRTILSLQGKLNPLFFQLRHFEDAKWLASSLSRNSCDPHACQMALGELLLNAIEHGNLEIGYEEKTRLIQERTWL